MFDAPFKENPARFASWMARELKNQLRNRELEGQIAHLTLRQLALAVRQEQRPLGEFP
jgi:hypothetical protein